MFKKIGFFIVIFSCFYVNSYADENGVDTTVTTYTNVQIKNADHFVGDFVLTSTVPIYNMDGGTLTASGSINIEPFIDQSQVQIGILALAANTVTVFIRSKLGDSDTWFDAVTIDYGTTTLSGDDPVNVLEYGKDFRIGAKVSTGSATINIRSAHILKRF